MPKFAATFLLLLSVHPFFFAQGKKLVEQEFKNKNLFLRGFYSDDKLRYDAQGNVEGNPKAGSWELALIHIDDVDVRSHELHLRGRRFACMYGPADRKFINIAPVKRETIDVIVEVSADNLSPAELNTIADKIFLSTMTYKTVPDYWRDFFLGKTEVPDPSPGPRISLQWDGRQVYRPGTSGGDAPPRLLQKTEPKYTETARLQKVEGTVLMTGIIDPQGNLQDLQVLMPIGLGLDDSAVAAVEQWRFSAGTIAGKPAPILINVEVAFRLYH